MIFTPDDFIEDEAHSTNAETSARRANEKLNRFLDKAPGVFCWKEFGNWEAHQHPADARNQYIGKLIILRDLFK